MRLSDEEVEQRKKEWGDRKTAPLDEHGVPMSIAGAPVMEGVEADDPRLFETDRVQPIYPHGTAGWRKPPPTAWDSETRKWHIDRRTARVGTMLRKLLRQRASELRHTEVGSAEEAIAIAAVEMFETIVLNPGDKVRAIDRIKALEVIGAMAEIVPKEGKTIVVQQAGADSPFAQLGDKMLDLIRDALIEKQHRNEIDGVIVPPPALPGE